MKDLPPYSDKALSVVPGIYEHYKGGKYNVLGPGRVEKTLEEIIVYQRLSDSSIWTRDVEDFLSQIEVGGKFVPRFRKI